MLFEKIKTLFSTKKSIGALGYVFDAAWVLRTGITPCYTLVHEFYRSYGDVQS